MSKLSDAQDRGSDFTRDWLAGQALAGIGNWTPDYNDGCQAPASVQAARARWAYEQADAMLAARRRALQEAADTERGKTHD